MSSGSGSGSGADQHLLALLRAIRLRQAAPDAVAAGVADTAAALTEMSRRDAEEHEALPPGGTRLSLPAADHPVEEDHGPALRPRWAGGAGADDPTPPAAPVAPVADDAAVVPRLGDATDGAAAVSRLGGAVDDAAVVLPPDSVRDDAAVVPFSDGGAVTPGDPASPGTALAPGVGAVVPGESGRPMPPSHPDAGAGRATRSFWDRSERSTTPATPVPPAASEPGSGGRSFWERGAREPSEDVRAAGRTAASHQAGAEGPPSGSPAGEPPRVRAVPPVPGRSMPGGPAQPSPSPFDHGPQVRPRGLPSIDPTRGSEAAGTETGHTGPGWPSPADRSAAGSEPAPGRRAADPLAKPAAADSLPPTASSPADPARGRVGHGGIGAERTPGERGSGEGTPGERAPGEGTPGERTPGERGSGERISGEPAADDRPVATTPPTSADDHPRHPAWTVGERTDAAAAQAPRVPHRETPLTHIAPPMVVRDPAAPAAGDGMDPADDALLRQTQRLLGTSLSIAGGPGEVAGRFREALRQADPELLATLPGNAATQTAWFAAGLTWLAHHLGRPPELVAGCARLGGALAACGVDLSRPQLIGAALAEAMRAGTAPGAWRQDFDLAWRSTWQHAHEWIRHGAATPAEHWDAEVVEHDLRRPDLAVIRLRPFLPMPFRPGQYARIEVPALPGTWRPYSLAGAPRRNDLVELHVRAKTTGVSGTLVHHTRVGDRVRISRAEGAMTLPPAPAPDVLMIAGDTGVAPLKALLAELADTGDERSAVLFWGVRNLDELYDIAEITEIARVARRATVVPVVSEGNPGPYASGLVTDAVAAYGQWSAHEVYLAGPPLMLAATTAALLQLGVAADRIHHDAP